ncbi:MAG TPA: DNRLRE domain-containing protein [Actinomycetota bacterium]
MRRRLCLALALVTAVMLGAVQPFVTVASAATRTIPVLKDATVNKSAPTRNFGTDAALGTDGSPEKRILMVFDLSSLAGQSPTSAKIRLWCVNKSSKGGSLHLQGAAWSETTVTWNTPLTIGSDVIGKLGTVTTGKWYEIDVTSVIAGRSELSLVMTSTSSDGADYASREASSGNGPQLVVTTPDGPPPNQAPRVTISAPADGSSVAPDTPVTFTGTATDEDGSLTGSLIWTSDVDGTIGSGGSVTHTFATTGPRTITASVEDSQHLSGSASISIRVEIPPPNQAPRVTISAPADGSSVVRDTEVTFTGSATDEDGSLTGSLIWTSDVDGTIGSGGSATHTFTSLGQRTITAAVTDSQGAEGSASITIDVVAPPAVTTFDVGLVGDTGYTSSEVTAFKNLRDTTLNKAGLAFVTHDGDIKSGSDPCTDSVYTTWRDIFNGFTSPLIYTPGDNEWKDCSDPNGRLAFLRQIFFSTNESLGQTRLTLTRQAGYPENARWTYGNVVFATINTPGSNNNSGDKVEYTARNQANLDWMRAAFAAGENARGVVIVTQANWGAPYGDTVKSAFADSVKLLEDLTVAYGKPVVFVHGDTHHFRIDHPMTHDGQVVSTFTRVETYGPSSTNWVKLSIVADSRVFVASSQSPN